MPFPPEDKSFAGLLKDMMIRLNLIERRLNKGIPYSSGGSVGLTPEQVRDITGQQLWAGPGITVTVDDAGDRITLGAPGALDAEGVRDVIAATLQEGANIDIIVDDASNVITISATGGGGGGGTEIEFITRTAYDLLSPPDPDTLYAIDESL